jgi:hypothetical protein
MFGLCAGVTAVILGFAVTQPAGPASAQDGTQPMQQQPPGAASPGEPTTDPITNAQIQLLKESGLIDKQSKLSEGLLLMQRQLQQAQLVEQLISVLGPDAQIEVAPGEFKSFANTPAGLQQQIDYLKLQGDLQEARLTTGLEQDTRTRITEILGQSNDLVAVISFDGRKRAVVPGDQLEDGTEILNITPEKVEIQRSDGTIEVLNAP